MSLDRSTVSLGFSGLCFHPSLVSSVIPALLFCHPGLEPGSRAHSRSMQRAAVNTGSRVFALDDKYEDSMAV
jgi:hypothetical protein